MLDTLDMLKQWEFVVFLTGKNIRQRLQRALVVRTTAEEELKKIQAVTNVDQTQVHEWATEERNQLKATNVHSKQSQQSSISLTPYQLLFTFCRDCSKWLERAVCFQIGRILLTKVIIYLLRFCILTVFFLECLFSVLFRQMLEGSAENDEIHEKLMRLAPITSNHVGACQVLLRFY